MCDNLMTSYCRFQTGKPKLTSQQNSIRARTRPAISPPLLLIYIRTSAAPLRQPELNPGEGGREGRGGCSDSTFNSTSDSFSRDLPDQSAFNYCCLLMLFVETVFLSRLVGL